MKRDIQGFLKDEENHWVAKLSCGHVQHVRHDPPWTIREWVITHEGRQSRIGEPLDCKICDELTTEIFRVIQKQIHDAFWESGALGLCREGREEAIFSVLSDTPIPFEEVAKRTAK